MSRLCHAVRDIERGSGEPLGELGTTTLCKDTACVTHAAMLRR